LHPTQAPKLLEGTAWFFDLLTAVNFAEASKNTKVAWHYFDLDQSIKKSMAHAFDALL
jgi:hypothetical protein